MPCRVTASHRPWLELHLLQRWTHPRHCSSPHHAVAKRVFLPNSPVPLAAPSPPARYCLAYVADDGQVSDGLQDGEPDANALCSLSHQPPVVTDELVGIQADLHPVVEQGKEGCQGTGRHKDGDEAALQDCNEEEEEERGGTG